MCIYKEKCIYKIYPILKKQKKSKHRGYFLNRYAPFYNMTIIRTLKCFSKLYRCHISLLSIVYDIVFHMERKINYLILFYLFLIYKW
jgi:hypothetical protein